MGEVHISGASQFCTVFDTWMCGAIVSVLQSVRKSPRDAPPTMPRAQEVEHKEWAPLGGVGAVAEERRTGVF